MLMALTRTTSTCVLLLLAAALSAAGCNTETAETATPKLVAAVEANDTASAKALLAKRPEIAKTAKNQYGVPVLLLAIRHGNAELVDVLLTDGADANGTAGGSTPIHAALGPPVWPAVVKSLLDHGADPGVRTSLGVTPLMKAAQLANKETVDALLAKGADANARVEGLGWSVLHYGVAGGDADVVDALVQKGAKLDAKDSEGRTPLQLAQSAAAPAKTPEQEEEEVKALARTDPAAAARLAAKRVVNGNTGSPVQGKDMTKVIAVLKRAGAT
jgi:ankyrin repeat protein